MGNYSSKDGGKTVNLLLISWVGALPTLPNFIIY